MALWEKTQKLTGAQLKELQSIYGEHFPLELRDYLAPWIELQPWSEVDPNNRNHQLHASTLFTDMLECLKKLHGNLRQPFIVRLKAEQHAAAMKLRYQTQPLEFVRAIQNCLLKEQQLVEHHDAIGMQDTANPNPVLIIDRGLQQIAQMTEKLEAEHHVLQNRQDQFVLRYQEVIKLDATLKQAADQLSADHIQELNQRKQKLDDHLQQEVKELNKQRQQNIEGRSFGITNGKTFMATELGNNSYKCLQEVTKIQGIVLSQELAKWKIAQRLCVQEIPDKKELDQLQQWCEQLAELLWRNRILIVQFDKLRKEVPINDPHDPGICHHLLTHVGALLQKLVEESFIIEKQPPQVLRIKKSFSAEIRLLVGTKLNIHMSTPEVEASIVNDKQARQVLQKPSIIRDNIGEILNNKRNMEYQSSDQTVVCKFSSMQIKNRVRRSAGSDQNVTEEKVAIVFQSVLHVGREVELTVKVISLPVVVVVHGVQHSSAEATVFWDNYFAEPDRELFVVPDHVPWSQFSQALSNYFEQQTGRGLNEQNLQYLAKRLQNAAAAVTPSVNTDLQDFIVTYSMIIRDHLQTNNPTRKGERGTTFWEWFYATCDLVRSCIKEEWKANLVHGFLDRQDAHDMLQECAPGTFLIRFSQSQAGLSVAFKKLEEDQTTSIRDLMPWARSRLISERRMSNRLQDLGELKYLYPNRDKNEAFQEFYTTDADEDEQSRVTTSGYIKTEMKMSINGSGGFPETASSQPSPMNPWIYSPAASSHPGMSPFPVTSPAIDIISPMNEASINLEDLMNDLEPLNALAITLTPDITELVDQILSLNRQLEQGKINYNTEQLKEILDAINKLKPTLEQKLSTVSYS